MNPTDYIFAACGTLLALIVLLRKENGHARQSTKRITHERAPRDPTITVSEQTRFCQLCYDQRYLSLYVWTQQSPNITETNVPPQSATPGIAEEEETIPESRGQKTVRWASDLEASVECNISPEEKQERKALAKVGRNFHHYKEHGVWPEGVNLREAEFYLATSIWPKSGIPPEAPKKCAGEKETINHQELCKNLFPSPLPEAPKKIKKRQSTKRPPIRRFVRPSARATDKSQPMRPPTAKAKMMELGLLFRCSIKETEKKIKKRQSTKRPPIRRFVKPSTMATNKSQPMKPPTAKAKGMELGFIRTLPLYPR